jgi:SAM-dependent methyltransferase
MNKIIDLGMHPFADTFVSKNQLNESEPVYPLECFLDKDTGEVKVGVRTDAHGRYIAYDYSYTSANSKFSKDHWINFAKDVNEKLNLPKNSNVVEIGSNDGFLTKQFKDMGYNVLGVDPSPYVKDLALELGVETYCDFFGYEVSNNIGKDFGQANLIIANNVFNHTNDIEDFTAGVENLLNDDGIFVFELPYWYNTIKDQKFDQIYHEHVTYFTVKFSYELLKKHGLEIMDVDVVNYHGGSLRVFAKKKDEIVLQPHIKSMIEEEESFGLFKESTYVKFVQDLHQKRNTFLKKIYKIKSKGYSIIGIGAAAKGNTLLNFYNLDNSVIDYITDSSEHKQGKYTPLTRIPIVGDEIFGEYDKVYGLILSWNISDIIKENLRKINKKIKFLECKPV